MIENLHFKGIWFLPGDESKQIAGFLDYSPAKGVELQLLGTIGERSVEMSDISIIWGVTADGKRITLYKNSLYSQSMNSNGLEVSSYVSVFMFIGSHLDEVDLKFSSIKSEYEDFDSWLDIYGFSNVEFEKETQKASVEYQQPKDILLSLPKNNSCKFLFSTYMPLSRHHSQIAIRQVCEVVLFSNEEEEKPFAELFELHGNFLRLLTLAYFQVPMELKLIVCKKSKKGNHIYDIEVYHKALVTQNEYSKRNHSSKFLFTYPEVKENFESILQKWFEAEESLSPTISGLAETLINRERTTEFAFLNVAHAIEILHRRRRKNTILSKKDYKEKVSLILSAVDSKETEWLKSKLEFGNEPTLQQRLEELVDELPEDIKTILLKPSPKEFIKHFKHSRNYYTHYNESLEKKALKGSDLFYLIERSKILLICLVLKEIGFTHHELGKIIMAKGVFLFNHIIKYDEAKNYFHKYSDS